MKRSPKLPAFAGRCHVQLLPGTAAHAADTANMLALLTPTPRESRALAALPAGITARTGNRALWLLLPLLLLAGLMTHCTSPRKAAQQRHREEHPAPFSRNGWNWDNPIDN